MIDFHSQIFSDIKLDLVNLREKVNSLNAAVEAGFNHIVVAPKWDEIEEKPQLTEYIRIIDEMNKYIHDRNIGTTIYFSQEIEYEEQVVSLLKKSELATINNTNYVFVSFPLRESTYYSVIEGVFQLQLNGYRPILCQAEKYPFIIQNTDLIKELIKRDVIVYLDSKSVIGEYGKGIQKTAKNLLKNNLISLIGTNSKSVEDYQQCEKSYKKIKKIVGEEKYIELTQTNPKTILENDLYYPEQPKDNTKERKSFIKALG